ncbi:MAG TPA: hypothetical protein IAC03_04795 [Candidatus Coprenecus pullistercoris]|nr:hypothetical protein [Candidatus Coprenecus pullistercoris]
MKEIRHIVIPDPHDCCGCTVCASACPRAAFFASTDSIHDTIRRLI